MSEEDIKYQSEDIAKYNIKLETIKILDDCIKASVNNRQGKSSTKKLNSLLLSNYEHESELEGMVQDLYFFILMEEVINELPNNFNKKFDMKKINDNEICDMIIMELIIRIGNRTGNIFDSSLFPRAVFTPLCNWYEAEIKGLMFDNFQDEKMRKHFLIAVKKWYDKDELLHKLVADNKHIIDEYLAAGGQKRTKLFDYNNGSIYSDDTFTYGRIHFNGFDEDGKQLDKYVKILESVSLNEAFTEISREFPDNFEAYKIEEGYPEDYIFEPLDKFVCCCRLGDFNWGKKTKDMVIDEPIGNYFEVDKRK